MSEHKTNILHLIETTGPGGAETVLLNIVEALDRSQFTSIIALKDKGWLYRRLESIGNNPIVVRSHGSFDWRVLRDLSQIIRDYSIEIIHSHLPDANFYACLTGLLTATPVIATFHGMVGTWNRRSLKNRVKMALIKHCANRSVVVSDFLKQEMIRDWGFQELRVTRIYNGVDFDRRESALGAETIRGSFGIPTAAKLVCAVGNIREAKGYEFLLQSARKVLDVFPDTVFLIIGEGHGSLLEKLLELRKTLSLEQQVVLAGFRDDVPAILKACDVFVLSSVKEGLSIATIEAMGLGKPVVVTDSGGPAEIVVHERSGLLVPPADAEALAQGLIRVIKDEDFSKTIGANGRSAVRERFGIADTIKSYVELYRSLSG